MRRGVIGLETFIHAKFVCVGNHTQGLTAMQVSKPLPKQCAPLGMKAIMKATHLVILKQSPRSDRAKSPAAGRKTNCVPLCPQKDMNYVAKTQNGLNTVLLDDVFEGFTHRGQPPSYFRARDHAGISCLLLQELDTY